VKNFGGERCVRRNKIKVVLSSRVGRRSRGGGIKSVKATRITIFKYTNVHVVSRFIGKRKTEYFQKLKRLKIIFQTAVLMK